METERVESTRSMWWVIAVAVVIGVVIGAIAVVVFWPDDSSAKAVSLERADESGDDPFTDSVQTDPVVIEQPALDVASDVRDDLPRDDTTSVLVATGTAAGLYGGSGDLQVCDAAKLVAYLGEHQDKAQAFSQVLGITPDDIPDYVGSLTPVVLMSDTLVTNHGFRDGHATELTSVLQAGTAVMVDRQGVPRVKCNCGNPLTPPEVLPTNDWALRGDAWDGFDRAAVTGIVAGDTVDEFTLCDLVTGRPFTRPVGSAIGTGTEPPNIDGQWTIELRSEFDVMSPLPPGRLDPRRCPTASLEGAVLTVEGRRATITGATFFGVDLVGTVEGAPDGSPDWVVKAQQAFNGAVIKVHPDGEDAPVITLAVSVTADALGGRVSMTGAQDPSVQVTQCSAGVYATRGTREEPSTTASTTTSTPSTTEATVPTAPPTPSGAPCDVGTLTAVVQSYVGEPIVGLSVHACNERWAAVSYGVDGQDDAGLLEWDGSAWITGACQRYRDPSDWTKSPVVPPEFWMPCIVD